MQSMFFKTMDTISLYIFCVYKLYSYTSHFVSTNQLMHPSMDVTMVTVSGPVANRDSSSLGCTVLQFICVV